MALTKKQKEVFDYIGAFYKENGFSPTQREIMEYFGLKSLGSVQDYIKYLTTAGYLVNDPHSVRGLMPKNISSTPNQEIPLLGNIAAGVPIEVIEQNSDSIAVPPTLLGRGPHYALKVKGQSMIEAGILDGDIAIIKHQSQAQNGQIVVALVNNETTLKTYVKKAKHIELQPANSSMKPFVIKDNQECEIHGILVGLLRTY